MLSSAGTAVDSTATPHHTAPFSLASAVNKSEESSIVQVMAGDEAMVGARVTGAPERDGQGSTGLKPRRPDSGRPSRTVARGPAARVTK